MKKVVIALICFISPFFLSGCLIIPLGKELHSEEVFGTRFDQQGNITEEILKRDIRHNIFVPIAPCGAGMNYLITTEYHIKEDNDTKKLPCSNYLGSGYIHSIKKPVLPIIGSSKWIAVKQEDIKSRYVADICIVIFDKKKTYRKLRISNCSRIQLKKFIRHNYDLEFKEGNAKVIVHTTDGDYLLDVINDTYIKK